MQINNVFGQFFVIFVTYGSVLLSESEINCLYRHLQLNQLSLKQYEI